MTLYVYNPFTNNLDAIGDNNFPDPVPVADGGTGRSSLTAHSVLIGEGTSPVNFAGPSASSGIPLISQGAASDPIFGTATVPGGGTGATTLTNHGVLLGQGTSVVVATAVGATGAVLMGSTGADPAFTTTPTIAGNTTISGSLTMNGGMIQKRTATATSYTVLVTDVIVAVTDTTAARTITMPNSGLVAGQRWTIKDESGGAATHAITISGNGANVDGVASQVMNTNYGSVDIYCNGTNFFLV